MAINIIGKRGTFIPLPAKATTNCRDDKTTWGGRTYYTYDFRFKREDPLVIVRWLRANMGELGVGWNFILNNIAGTLVIEIWDSKLQFMYEMWKT